VTVSKHNLVVIKSLDMQKKLFHIWFSIIWILNWPWQHFVEHISICSLDICVSVNVTTCTIMMINTDYHNLTTMSSTVTSPCWPNVNSN